MNKQKRKLTINFKNGLSKTITPVKDGESFFDFSQEERDNISSLRFVLGDQTFTITRKVNNQVESTGFFYHIMEGRKIIIGDSNRDNPLIRERIGYCYRCDGLSSAVVIDYIKGNVEFVTENLNTMGVNVGRFHDMKDRKAGYDKQFLVFRKAFVQKPTPESLPEIPQIPFMPADGVAPRVLFNSKDVSEYYPKI